MDNYEERVQRAVTYFKSGYNCSQSVVAAFADIYGFSEEQALRMSASFGAGIGRMRQTCGAACGMFLLVGLQTGATRADDREGKSYNYKVVQCLAERFRELNGSLVCAELLGLANANTDNSPQASERTELYYKKRPCAKMVEAAAKIFADFLQQENNHSTL